MQRGKDANELSNDVIETFLKSRVYVIHSLPLGQELGEARNGLKYVYDYCVMCICLP